MKKHTMPVAASLALAAAACGGGPSAAAGRPRGVPVRVAAVETRDLVDTLVVTGTLRPRAQVQVVAEVSARLLRVLKDEGARVGQGETLAVLDGTDYRLAHDRARAALEVAQANRAHAEAERARADNLLKTGGITDREHLAAQVQLQVAEASLAQARAEAAIAAQQQARARVVAPFAGRVARRQADPGTMLSAGAPLFTLVDDSVLEFRASVPSADYDKVRVGATVEVTADAVPGVTAKGRVARLTPLVDERTRSFDLTVEVPGDGRLVGGLFARATVSVRRVPGALVVPPSALQRDGTQPGVAQAFAVVAGVAQRRTVTVGVEDAGAVQVVAGLAAGEQVVLDPPVALGDGAPVEVVAGRAAGAAGTGGAEKETR
ncbi:MAG TPA: efflux RND transporter periplasmic adaptor subunit [Vicinamibacteria bacterium]|jgi:RND family efflux transporter MFP subunit